MISYARQQLLAEKLATKSRRGSGKLIAPGSEDQIQSDFIRWVDLHKERFPALRLIFAIPNAGFASVRQGVLRKLTGRRKGVPDVCIPVANSLLSRTKSGSNRSACPDI